MKTSFSGEGVHEPRDVGPVEGTREAYVFCSMHRKYRLCLLTSWLSQGKMPSLKMMYRLAKFRYQLALFYDKLSECTLAH